MDDLFHTLMSEVFDLWNSGLFFFSLFQRIPARQTISCCCCSSFGSRVCVFGSTKSSDKRWTNFQTSLKPIHLGFWLGLGVPFVLNCYNPLTSWLDGSSKSSAVGSESPSAFLWGHFIWVSNYWEITFCNPPTYILSGNCYDTFSFSPYLRSHPTPQSQKIKYCSKTLDFTPIFFCKILNLFLS